MDESNAPGARSAKAAFRRPSVERLRDPIAYYSGMADGFVLVGVILLAAGAGTFALYFMNFSEAFLFLVPALVLPLVAAWAVRRFLPAAPEAANLAALPTPTFTAPARKGT